MHTKSGPDLPPDLLKEMGYETRDVVLDTLVRWLFALLIFIAIACVGTVFLYNFFVPKEAMLVYGGRPQPPLKRVPPMPQLQTSPKREMADFRRAEKVWANELTYATEDKQFVNIPVDVAIEKYAAKGIAGVTESNEPKREKSYPGSGDFAPVTLYPAEDTAPGDVTNATESANALGESLSSGSRETK